MMPLMILIWHLYRLRLDRTIQRYVSHPLLWILFLPAKFFPTPKMTEAVRIRLLLERMGPIFVKLGQLLSTRPDLIPEVIANELCQLQDKVTPENELAIVKILEEQWGMSVDNRLVNFERQPIASASVAQVHRAQLMSGEAVAVKVLRPDIRTRVAKNIAFLRWLAKCANGCLKDAKRMRLIEIVDDYQYTIEQECELLNEAANTQKLRDNFINNPLHYTPKVYWDYCNQDVMVMEYIDGMAVNDIDKITEQNIDLKQLAEQGVKVFFIQVFQHNFFHADMHPGNILVRKTAQEQPQYVALDSAIIGSLSNMELIQLGSLWLSVFERDYRKAAQSMIASKWVEVDTDVSRLEALIRRLFEPVHNKPFAEIAFAGMLFELFEHTRQFGLKIQPSQVLLQKTLINIEGMGKQIYPNLDLFSIAKPFLREWLARQLGVKATVENLVQKLPQLVDWAQQAINEVEAKKERDIQQQQQKYYMLASVGSALLAGGAAGLIAIHLQVVSFYPALMVMGLVLMLKNRKG